MSVKQFVPAVKYGNAITSDEVDLTGATGDITFTAGDPVAGTQSSATIGSGKVTGAKTSPLMFYNQVAIKSTAASSVNVFGSTNGFAGTVTGFCVGSLDQTAGTITLAGVNGTIATAAKGTTYGGMTQGSLSASATYTAFTSGGTLQIVGGGGGNVVAYITFTVA